MASLTHRIGVRSDGSLDLGSLTPLDINLTVPNDGHRYVIIKHDYEMPPRYEPRQKEDFGVTYAIPAIVNEVRRVSPNLDYIPEKYRGRAYDYVALTEKWQFFLRDLFAWSVWNKLPYGVKTGTYRNWSNPEMIFDRYTEGSLLEYYTNMIQDARSHTDSEPPEAGFCDFVTKRNMGERPYSWLTKTTTGNLLRVIADLGSELKVEALDLAGTPPPISEVVKKPWLIHWATEQTMVKLPDKSYVVSRYPQAKVACRFHGYPETGTPIPNTSVGGYYFIDKSRTTPVSAGTKYSPYTPKK